jgi:hypothetical protein
MNPGDKGELKEITRVPFIGGTTWFHGGVYCKTERTIFHHHELLHLIACRLRRHSAKFTPVVYQSDLASGKIAVHV